MHSPFTPTTADGPRTPRNAFREALHGTQRTFLAVNAIPLAVSVALLPATNLASVRVGGHLTIGVVWGLLQCVLFVTSTWWYELRCTRACDPLEQPVTSGTPQPGNRGTSGGGNRHGR
ncbi:hypothetical protein ACFXOS_22600 [Streptomyces sp. NPDC059175]|uniref:hypothetical protein n=1 Tax=Streptomyces sp. NPDC059175 TaxID=3346757 RepID=UPI0036B6E894